VKDTKTLSMNDVVVIYLLFIIDFVHLVHIV